MCLFLPCNIFDFFIKIVFSIFVILCLGIVFNAYWFGSSEIFELYQEAEKTCRIVRFHPECYWSILRIYIEPWFSVEILKLAWSSFRHA